MVDAILWWTGLIAWVVIGAPCILTAVLFLAWLPAEYAWRRLKPDSRLLAMTIMQEYRAQRKFKKVDK